MKEATFIVLVAVFLMLLIVVPGIFLGSPEDLTQFVNELSSQIITVTTTLFAVCFAILALGPSLSQNLDTKKIIQSVKWPIALSFCAIFFTLYASVISHLSTVPRLLVALIFIISMALSFASLLSVIYLIEPFKQYFSSEEK